MYIYENVFSLNMFIFNYIHRYKMKGSLFDMDLCQKKYMHINTAVLDA